MQRATVAALSWRSSISHHISLFGTLRAGPCTQKDFGRIFSLQKDLCATAGHGFLEVLRQETKPEADGCTTVFSVNTVNIDLSSPILLWKQIV